MKFKNKTLEEYIEKTKKIHCFFFGKMKNKNQEKWEMKKKILSEK